MSDPVVTASYHTHNTYCDGQSGIEEMVEAAIAANLTEIGISSHAPLPFETNWSMPPERLSDYVREVRALQEKYRDRIAVLLAAEIDILPDPRVEEFQRREVLPLEVDYFIGSVHFLGAAYPPQSFDGYEERFRTILQDDYGNDVEALAVDYYRRVREGLGLPKVRIVGHLDRVVRWNAGQKYFRDDEPWYVDAVEETLAAIAASGKIVELNTSGWRKGAEDPFPAPWILRRCACHGIPVTITSDAHSPDEVTWGFERARALLDEIGVRPVRLATVAG
ncbi:MAG: histidinol-phosphatase [Chloroflexi bacterium]|nr:histidinol-phosphatase [Chloroflexota bacterium]